MFSFRIIGIAALTVYLLPTDPVRQESFARTADQAMTWAATFCDRNSNTCETVCKSWDVMKTKATFGAGIVYDVAMRQLSGREDAPRASNSNDKGRRDLSSDARNAVFAPMAAGRGTLTVQDLAPAWRGYEARGVKDSQR